MNGPIFPIAMFLCVIGFLAAAVTSMNNADKTTHKDVASLNRLGFKNPAFGDSTGTYQVPFGSCKIKLTKNADGKWTYKDLVVSSEFDLRNKAQAVGLAHCF